MTASSSHSSRPRQVRSRSQALLLGLLVALAVVLVGCADEPDPGVVVGVVSQVTGDPVESFAVVDDEGTTYAFQPVAGLTCDGEPLTHLRVHLLDRDRIRVAYEEPDEGPLLATEILHVGNG